MLLEDGRLSHPGIGAHHRRKQVEARLVGEHYGLLAFLERPLFEGRPPLFFPAFYGLLIALLGLALRLLLETLFQRFEQTTHVSRVVADPELFADDRSHPLAGPYLSLEAMRLGSSCQ